MVTEDILTSMKNALERGQSLEKTMNSLIMSGYNPRDVDEASRFFGRTASDILKINPDDNLIMPSERKINFNLKLPPEKISPTQFQAPKERPALIMPVSNTTPQANTSTLRSISPETNNTVQQNKTQYPNVQQYPQNQPNQQFQQLRPNYNPNSGQNLQRPQVQQNQSPQQFQRLPIRPIVQNQQGQSYPRSNPYTQILSANPQNPFMSSQINRQTQITQPINRQIQPQSQPYTQYVPQPIVKQPQPQFRPVVQQLNNQPQVRPIVQNQAPQVQNQQIQNPILTKFEEIKPIEKSVLEYKPKENTITMFNNLPEAPKPPLRTIIENQNYQSKIYEQRLRDKNRSKDSLSYQLDRIHPPRQNRFREIMLLITLLLLVGFLIFTIIFRNEIIAFFS